MSFPEGVSLLLPQDLTQAFRLVLQIQSPAELPCWPTEFLRINGKLLKLLNAKLYPLDEHHPRRRILRSIFLSHSSGDSDMVMLSRSCSHKPTPQCLQDRSKPTARKQEKAGAAA